jgi:hypothetical protein
MPSTQTPQAHSLDRLLKHNNKQVSTNILSKSHLARQRGDKKISNVMIDKI